MRSLLSNIFSINSDRGFSLMELMVSLGLFGIIGMSFVSFQGSALHTLAVEGQASIATQELRNALGLMSTELRMSTSISPYLVGNTASTVTCSSSFALTSTTVKFLVVQDDPTSATAGIKPYYVGYRYDASKKQLLRGEIAGNSITSCAGLTAGDPTSTNVAVVLAENVVAIDGSGDGVVDAAFQSSGNSVVVNLGIQISGSNNRVVEQPMPIAILRRRA